MQKIVIDATIEGYAQAYATDLKATIGDVRNKLDNLLKAIKKYNNKIDILPYQSYINEIKSDYDDLLILKPSKFKDYISKYNTLKNEDSLTQILVYKSNKKGETKSKKFYELISDTMKYKSARMTLAPYILKMGIETCVYCNAQYAITSQDGKPFYEFDHFKSQSDYPFLCTTFYNLQPSCPFCNKSKKNKSCDFNLYTEIDTSDNSPFLFIPQMENFDKTKDPECIRIDFKDKDRNLSQSVKDYNKIFHIEEVYSCHKDVVEDFYWKNKCYTKSYFQSFHETLGVSENIKLLKRFFFGTNMDGNSIHKHPFTKLIQDTAKQIGLDKRFKI
jgi:hypothetical protein